MSVVCGRLPLRGGSGEGAGCVMSVVCGRLPLCGGSGEVGQGV